MATMTIPRREDYRPDRWQRCS